MSGSRRNVFAPPGSPAQHRAELRALSQRPQASCWSAPLGTKPSLPTLLLRVTFCALLGLQPPAARGGRPLPWGPLLSHPSLSLWDLTPPCCQRRPTSHFAGPPVLSPAWGIILGGTLTGLLDPLSPSQQRMWVSTFAAGYSINFPLYLWAPKHLRAALCRLGMCPSRSSRSRGSPCSSSISQNWLEMQRSSPSQTS